MSTQLRVPNESYPMNTSMGLDDFQKSLNPGAFDGSSLSIGRVKTYHQYPSRRDVMYMACGACR